MSDALYTAASGAAVQQMRLEVLANNLANINAVGFKQDRPVFGTYLSKSVSEPAAENDPAVAPAGAASIGPMPDALKQQVRFESTVTDFTNGSLRQTGRSLDVALKGRGFLVVETAQGIRYTRNGSLSLNAEGLLVTGSGYPVQGRQGAIRMGEGRIDIDDQGNVIVDGGVVDQLKLADFADLRALTKTGDGLFVPRADGPGEAAAENVTVHQGFLEMANISPVRLMTEMIEVHRSYEAQQKVIRSLDETNAKTVGELVRI